MKQGDLLIYYSIVFIIIFSLLLSYFLNLIWSSNQNIEAVVVEFNNDIYTRIPLPSPEKTIEVTGPWGILRLDLDGHKVRINPASPHFCPDKICKNQGWISKPPAAIICLPNRIVVHYQGGSRIDGLTH